jgi:hypothetical protein
MDETRRAANEILDRARAKNARRAVSKKLALYHQSLVDALSEDTNSFFNRVMEQAQHDISVHRDQHRITRPPRLG